MLKIWTDHIDKHEEKEEFVYEIRAAHRILKRLEDILKMKQEASMRKLRSPTLFEKLFLKERIQNELAYQRAMDDILTLLKDRNNND